MCVGQVETTLQYEPLEVGIMLVDRSHDVAPEAALGPHSAEMQLRRTDLLEAYSTVPAIWLRGVNKIKQCRRAATRYDNLTPCQLLYVGAACQSDYGCALTP